MPPCARRSPGYNAWCELAHIESEPIAPSWHAPRRDRTTRLASKVTTFVQQGDRLATVTPGGGGWGDPLDRDVEQVRRDVLEGLVSVERAREVYGVVLDAETLELDRDATRAPPADAQDEC